MRSRLLNLYVGGMCVAAVVTTVLANWGDLLRLELVDVWGLLALIGIGLLSESKAIRLDVGKAPGNSSITFIPLLASVQLFGPPAAVVLLVSTGSVGELVVRKKEAFRAVFNIAQWVVSAAIAGAVFVALGGQPLAGAESVDWTTQILPSVAFAVLFLSLNQAAVAMAIALSQGTRFIDMLKDMFSRSGGNLLQDLSVVPLAILVAFFYMELKVWGIALVLFPLLFVRESYTRMLRLREANSDLLTALIKAIETRDPYTSGHSLRVSQLARRIAEVMGLPRMTVERVEHAALLHDIGKIEAVYTGILMKPAALSPDERAVIQSHVTKGEELLRKLSSVPDEVIQSVRHHHEREDGTGYPDGLSGKAIPLGAKIIAVCDAVDAMLSDRPYRSALTVPIVMQQLREHSGTQFDPVIVNVLLSTDLLVDYADIMRAVRDDGGRAAKLVDAPAQPSPSRRRAPWTGRISAGGS
jgi:putative nucleotidyltransferase with HDIG domain